MSEEGSEQPIWPVILVTILVGYAFYSFFPVAFMKRFKAMREKRLKELER